MCFPNATPRHEFTAPRSADPPDEDHPDVAEETPADVDDHGPRSGGASG